MSRYGKLFYKKTDCFFFLLFVYITAGKYRKRQNEPRGFRNFAMYLKKTYYSPFKKHEEVMSKTAKIILEIIAAICAGLLGGAGAQTLM